MIKSPPSQNFERNIIEMYLIIRKGNCMKPVILLFLLICASAVYPANLDSLVKIWNNHSSHDTIRLQAMDDLSYELAGTYPDSAFLLAQKEFDLASSKKYLKWQAWALNRQGLALFYKGDYIGAINLYMKSLKISQQTGDKKLMATCYLNSGLVYVGQGIYSKALESYVNSLRIYQKMRDRRGELSVYINISVIYYYMDDNSKALEYQFKALKLVETNDKHGLASSYMGIGIIYTSMKDYQKALQTLTKSKNLYEEIGDKYGIGLFYENVGYLYQKQGDFQLALVNYLECLKTQEKLNSKSGIASISNNIGSLHLSMKNYAEAINWCKKGLKISKETGLLEREKLACSCLYEAYKGLGNGSKALDYYEQYIRADDSIKKEATTKNLQHMEFQKKLLADSLRQEELKLKDKIANQEQLNKQKNQKRLFIFGGIAILFLAGGLWWRLRFTRKAKAVIEKEKDRSDHLLLNILPAEVAEELKATGTAEARDFEQVSILFSDFKGFTVASEKLSAKELVSEINHCFKTFDSIMAKYKIEKIKTIGDAYMAAGGLPVPDSESVRNTVKAALEMQEFIKKEKIERDSLNKISFEMRLGIHTGPVVAGIVGNSKFQYDIWGDSVNTANRMESSGEVGKVNISHSTYELIKDDAEFTFEYRGKISAKNKGEIDMYFVSKKGE